jgi:BCD family chlorophyll transporter-like MFS transporter
MERKLRQAATRAPREQVDLREVLSEIWHEPLARTFTVFVFASMLAYSAQDLILEPYAGLVFGYTLGQSTSLAGVQHGGVLLGMILLGLVGTLIKDDRTRWLRGATVVGCIASGASLAALATAGALALPWALQPAVFALGFFNGVFAVSAIGLMMSFAGAGRKSREGVRMGVWGASQAIAFAIGGFLGAAALDIVRVFVADVSTAFMSVFSVEALLFLTAAGIAARLKCAPASPRLGALQAQPS